MFVNSPLLVSTLNLVTKETDLFSHIVEILKIQAFLHECEAAVHLLAIEFVS